MSFVDWASIIGGGALTVFGGPAAPLGPSLIAAGVGGLATDKAKKQQTEATQQASADVQQSTQRATQRLDPYAQLGAGAAGQLGGLLGIPIGPGAGPVQTPAAGPGFQQAPQPAQLPATKPNAVAPLQSHTFTPTTLGQMKGSAGSAAVQSSASGYNDSGAGLITIQTADGKTRKVSAAALPAWLQKGATVVSGGDNGLGL
jgi:hypothetical protein